MSIFSAGSGTLLSVLRVQQCLSHLAGLDPALQLLRGHAPSHAKAAPWLAFVSGGLLNIVTEFADEGSLAQQLDRRRERQEAMEEAEVLDVLVQVLLALQHLHSKRVRRC